MYCRILRLAIIIVCFYLKFFIVYYVVIYFEKKYLFLKGTKKIEYFLFQHRVKFLQR